MQLIDAHYKTAKTNIITLVGVRLTIQRIDYQSSRYHMATTQSQTGKPSGYTTNTAFHQLSLPSIWMDKSSSLPACLARVKVAV